MHIGIIMNYVVPPLKYGGTNRIVAKLAKELIDRGNKVTLYAQPGSQVEGAIVRELPSDFECQSNWIDRTIDILHMHHPHRVVTDMPMLVSQQGNGLSNVFPCMSFVSSSQAKNHGSDCFVHNGLDVSDYPTAEKSDYLVFLADASWGVKNLRTAVQLAEDSKTKLLVMGGYGTDSKYVKFMGMVGEADGKLEVLAKAKGLIYLANWDEPCAVAVLESMACGTPVIATKNGCFPEIISSTSGLCVRSYSEALRAIDRLGEFSPTACRDHVATSLSQRLMTDKYISLYDAILNAKWSYKVPSYSFSSKLCKVYKPTLRNILHYEIRHRLAYRFEVEHDYSYRTPNANIYTKLNFPA